MQEVIKRFSEDKYATKEEVLNAYNLSSQGEKAWEDNLAYRKERTKTIDLFDKEGIRISYVLTDSLLNRLIRLERNWTADLLKLLHLSLAAQDEFRKTRELKVLKEVAKNSSADLNDLLLSQIIDNDISTIPNEAVIVSNYKAALDFIMKNNGGVINEKSLNDVSYVLTSGSLPLKDGSDFASSGLNFSLASDEKQGEGLLAPLCNYLNDQNEFLSVRAITALYYLSYLKPFDSFNEKLAVLDFKMVLSHNGLGEITEGTDIEELALNDSKEKKIREKISSDNHDITYYLDYLADYLLKDEEGLKADLLAAEALSIRNEHYNPEINEEKTEENENPDGNEEGESLSVPADEEKEVIAKPEVRKAEVALPVFSTGLDENDIEKIKNDLLETYPTLRPAQAHFYASHCVIGRSYTIQQFKECEGTSYETARTSMDYLAQIGLYSKAKVRKKFVYRPCPQRSE